MWQYSWILVTLLSLHFPNHYTPLWFCCTVPELASSLHSELGNSSGFPYQSDILSFSVFSLRVPTTPSASFPVGVQQSLDELKLSPSTSLLHTPTPSNSPWCVIEMCGKIGRVRSSIFSSETYKINGKGRQWIIIFWMDHNLIFTKLWPSAGFHMAVFQTPLSIPLLGQHHKIHAHLLA